MLPVARRVAIVVVVLVALPLLLACGEAEDLGSGAGSGDVTAVASPSADVVTPTSETADAFTPTPGVAGLPVFTAEPGMPTPDISDFEESGQAIEPEWLTLEEAQALVEFDNVMPEKIPEGLHFIGIGVDRLPDIEQGEVEGDGPLVAYLGFSFDAASELPEYVVLESLEPPIEFDDLPESGFAYHQLELLFGETLVTRTLYGGGCFEFIALSWSDGTMHYAAVSSAPGNTDATLTASLAGAVIGVEPPDIASLATPEPVEPTPNENGDYCDLTAQEARDLAPFPVYVPDETPPPFVLEQIDLVVQRWSSSEGYSPDGTAVIEPTPEMHESIELMMRYTIDGASENSSITITQRSLMANPMSSFFGGPDVDLVVIDGVEVRSYTFSDPQVSRDSSDTATATPEASDRPVMTMYGWVVGDTETTAQVNIAPDDAHVVTPDAVHFLIASFIRAAANP